MVEVTTVLGATEESTTPAGGGSSAAVVWDEDQIEAVLPSEDEEEEGGAEEADGRTERRRSRWAAASAARKASKSHLEEVGAGETASQGTSPFVAAAPAVAEEEEGQAGRRKKKGSRSARASSRVTRDNDENKRGAENGMAASRGKAAGKASVRRSARTPTVVTSHVASDYDLGANSDRDFTPRSQSRRTRVRSKPPADAPRIAFSGLLPADVGTLRQIGSSLGGVIVPEDEAHLATHLVLGNRSTKTNSAPKRTVKVLQAVLRGAWLLSDAWLLHSLEAGELLPEGPFETGAFKGAKVARQLRETSVPVEPLKGMSIAIVEADTEAHERLRQLAIAAGASLSSTTRAELWVGSGSGVGGASARTRRGAGANRKLVSSEWLYDSISNCEAMAAEGYLHSGA